MRRPAVDIIAALLLSAAFGAVDQYVGSLSAHPWAADLSGLSAPWLVLPFAAGWRQPTPRRAAVLGLACTYAALLGYCLMTLSPIEGAHLSLASIWAFLRAGNYRWFLAGALTGPLSGWAGYRWREGRPGLAALLAAAVCLEPLARAATGIPIRHPVVWVLEVAVGLAFGLVLARRALGRRAG